MTWLCVILSLCHSPRPPSTHIQSAQHQSQIAPSCKWKCPSQLCRVLWGLCLQIEMGHSHHHHSHLCSVTRPIPLVHVPLCPRLTSVSRGCGQYVTRPSSHCLCSPFITQENKKLAKDLQHKDEFIHFLRVEVGLDLLVGYPYLCAQSPTHLTYTRSLRSSRGHSNACFVLRRSLPHTGMSWWNIHIFHLPTPWLQ